MSKDPLSKYLIFIPLPSNTGMNMALKGIYDVKF